MDHKSLTYDGYQFMAERRVPYSNQSRRIYAKSDTDPLYVLEMTGTRVTRHTEYKASERDKALRHTQDGLPN